MLLAADHNGDKKGSDSAIAEEYKVSQRMEERLRERCVTEGAITWLGWNEWRLSV
jgi:hypothetical protein